MDKCENTEVYRKDRKATHQVQESTTTKERGEVRGMELGVVIKGDFCFSLKSLFLVKGKSTANKYHKM